MEHRLTMLCAQHYPQPPASPIFAMAVWMRGGSASSREKLIARAAANPGRGLRTESKTGSANGGAGTPTWPTTMSVSDSGRRVGRATHCGRAPCAGRRRRRRAAPSGVEAPGALEKPQHRAAHQAIQAATSHEARRVARWHRHFPATASLKTASMTQTWKCRCAFTAEPERSMKVKAPNWGTETRR